MSNCTPQSPGENNPSIPLPDGINCCAEIPDGELVKGGAVEAAWIAAGNEFADKFLEHCVNPHTSEPWWPNINECPSNDNECMRKFIPWFANCINSTAQNTGSFIPYEADNEKAQAKIDLYMKTIGDRFREANMDQIMPSLDDDTNPYQDLHGITTCADRVFNLARTHPCTNGPDNQPCQNGGQVAGNTIDGCFCQCYNGWSGTHCQNRVWREHPDVARVDPDELVRDCGTIFPSEVSRDACRSFYLDMIGQRPHENRINHCYNYLSNKRGERCMADTAEANCCRGLLAEYDYNCRDVEWGYLENVFRDQQDFNDDLASMRRNCNL